MARVVTCDNCGGQVGLSTFNEPPAPWLQVLPGMPVVGADDDGPPEGPRADVCSVTCLASWAMSQAMDQEASQDGR